MIEKFIKILVGLSILGCVVMCAGVCLEAYFMDYRYMPVGRAIRKIKKHIDFKLPPSMKPEEAKARLIGNGHREVALRFRFDWDELDSFLENADFLLGDNTHSEDWRDKDKQLSAINNNFDFTHLYYNPKAGTPIFWGRKWTANYMLTILGVWDGMPEKEIETYIEITLRGPDTKDEGNNYIFINYDQVPCFTKIPDHESLAGVKEIAGVDLGIKEFYGYTYKRVYRDNRAYRLVFNCDAQNLDRIIKAFGFHNPPASTDLPPVLGEIYSVLEDFKKYPSWMPPPETDNIALYAAVKNNRHETTMLVTGLPEGRFHVKLLVENLKHKANFAERWAVLEDRREKPATDNE